MPGPGASSPSGSPRLVNYFTATGTGTSLDVTVSGFAEGDLIVVGIRVNSESIAVTGVTDDGSPAVDWAAAPAYGPRDYSAAGVLRAYLFYGVASAGTPTTITVTVNVSVALQVEVLQFADMEPLASVLGAVSTGQNTAAFTHDVTSAVATTQSDTLLVSLTTTITDAAFSNGTDFTLVPAGLTRLAMQYRLLTAQGSYTSPMVTTAQENSVTILAVFNVAMAPDPPLDPSDVIVYCQSGIARSGATRSDYYYPHVHLTIGGQDWSSRVLKRTVRIEEVIDAQPNTAQLSVRADSLFAETLVTRSGLARSGLSRSGFTTSPLFRGVAGPEIVISLGAADNRIFAGYILALKTSVKRAGQRQARLQLGCADYTWLLDRYRITGRAWTNTPVSTIVSDILAFLPAAQNFTAVVDGTLGSLTFTANHLETISQVLTRLANRAAARYVIDYHKVIRMFRTTAGTTAPAPLDTSATHFWGLEIDSDVSSFRSRVYAIGGTSLTTAAVAVGATSIPVEDTSLFGSSGGEALSNGNYLTYTGRSAASGPGNLTGVPAAGTGSVLYAIAQGDPISVLATRDDVDAQSAFAARVGQNSEGASDDGIVAHVIRDARDGDDAARAAGDGDLVLNTSLEPRVIYSTRDKGARPGVGVVADLLSPLVVNGTLMIQRVEISSVGVRGKFPIRRVHAGGVRVDLYDVLAASVRSDLEL